MRTDRSSGRVAAALALGFALPLGVVAGCMRHVPAAHHGDRSPEALAPEGTPEQLKQVGVRWIEIAGEADGTLERAEAFDRAIAAFVRARRIYEEELLVAPSYRREVLRREIDRLQARIETCYRERPRIERPRHG